MYRRAKLGLEEFKQVLNPSCKSAVHFSGTVHLSHTHLLLLYRVVADSWSYVSPSIFIPVFYTTVALSILTPPHQPRTDIARLEVSR